jgi:hypothetical protein
MNSTFPPSLSRAFREGGNEGRINAKPWPPVLLEDESYWHEEPHVGSSSQKLTGKTDKQVPKQWLVGFRRWRFSKTGLVTITVERGARKLNKVTRKFEKRDIYMMKDESDDRTLPLDEATWRRLSPATTAIPGYGLQYIGRDESPSDERNCSRCGLLCSKRHGTAHSIGGHRVRGVLMGAEWAPLYARYKKVPADEMLGGFIEEFDGEGMAKVYYLCSRCIPAGFLYCSHCGEIHRDWYSSDALVAYWDIVEALNEGRVPNTMIERSYMGSGRDATMIIRREHMDDRLSELIELIGRCTVCRNPDKNIVENMTTYQSELGRLYHEWAEAERLAPEHEEDEDEYD